MRDVFIVRIEADQQTFREAGNTGKDGIEGASSG